MEKFFVLYNSTLIAHKPVGVWIYDCVELNGMKYLENKQGTKGKKNNKLTRLMIFLF